MFNKKILFVAFLVGLSCRQNGAFHPNLSSRRKLTFLASSVGGGPPPPRDDDGDGDSNLDDFLDPNKQESENLQRAREFMSDNSLPISFDADVSIDDAETFFNAGNSSSLALIQGSPTGEMIARNPYMAVVSSLSPSEMISKFTSTAHPRVQNAVRSTILGLIGGLPKLAFDTNVITTGQRLASLMFQLQMTGYMFKNAEYRLSLQQSLGDGLGGSTLLLTGADEEEEVATPVRGKIRGKLKLRYDSITGDIVQDGEPEKQQKGLEVEVDAEAFTSELRSEVSRLREELSITRKEKEETLRKDLLAYIRTLPEKEMQSLTNTMSQDVLVAMKGLVNAVLAGVGEGQIGADTVTEQSGEAMAQLCMWQLVIGYNLRTLEVREEMKKTLKSLGAGPEEASKSTDDSIGGAFG